MKIKWINLIILIIIGSIVILGCTPDGQSALASPSKTIKKATIATISTSTPSMTIAFTQAPTSTATLTPLPSISPEIVLQIINQHFQEGEQCIEPCFFGVVPGKTTIGEAQNTFLQLGMPIDFMVPENNKKVYSTNRGFETGLGLSLQLIVQDDVVQDVKVGVEPPDYSLSLRANGLSGYSIENLLNRYGSPSAVEFQIDYPHESGFPPGTAWYDMTVYFESSNVIVQFYNAVTKEGDLIKACPIKNGFKGVRIWIGETPRNPPFKGIPLETASKISLDKFYDSFIEGNENSCIELETKVFLP